MTAAEPILEHQVPHANIESRARGFRGKLIVSLGGHAVETRRSESVVPAVI